MMTQTEAGIYARALAKAKIGEPWTPEEGRAACIGKNEGAPEAWNLAVATQRRRNVDGAGNPIRTTTWAPAASPLASNIVSIRPRGPVVEPFAVSDTPPDWLTAHIPRRKFALGTACPLGAVTLLCAQGGGGKSMLLLQASMGLACGRGLVPNWEPDGPDHALLIPLEDENPEIRRRAQRIGHACVIHDDEADMVAQNLHTIHLARPDFFRLNASREIVAGPHLDLLKAELANGDYALCVIDPVASLLAGVIEENSNQAAQKIVNMLTEILPATTALLLATHVAKMDREFSTSPRGAGAWSDAARQAWGMRPLTATEAADLPSGVEPRDVVVLHCLKSNYTRMPEPVFLRCRTDPAAGGVLQYLDISASKASRQEAEREELDRTLLEVLANQPVSLSELAGVTKGESYKRGQLARNSVAEILGRKATIRDYKEAAERLLTAGRLFQTTSENGTKSLIPAVIGVA